MRLVPLLSRPLVVAHRQIAPTRRRQRLADATLTALQPPNKRTYRRYIHLACPSREGLPSYPGRILGDDRIRIVPIRGTRIDALFARHTRIDRSPAGRNVRSTSIGRSTPPRRLVTGRPADRPQAQNRPRECGTDYAFAMHKLYVVHSSHPCEAVKKALELKAMPFRTFEMLLPTQLVITRLRFPNRTVPALRLDGGEKVQGSRAILRRLDELVPEPRLLPCDEAARSAALDAERWGDEVLQPLARRVVWGALQRNPGAIPSFQESSKLPRLPRPVVRFLAPGVIAIERKVNKAAENQVRADLRALPGHVDRIDEWIAAGVLGGAAPNAADLQIGASLRLLRTIGDLQTVLAKRPAEALATRLFPTFPGNVPAGTYPAAWLSAARS